MQVTSTQIDLDTASGPMRTYVHEPRLDGRAMRAFPGLIFYSEIFQQTEPIRRLGIQFASRGFVVMVPEVYHSDLAPGTVLAYDDAGKTRGNELKYATPLQVFDADAATVIAALARHPRCNGRLGAVGVCLGGHLAFRCALRKEILAAGRTIRCAAPARSRASC